MSWNHRVMEFEDPASGEKWLAIHEVHYDSQDVPYLYTENAAEVISEDMAGLGRTLDWMREALAKPILRESDFKP